MLNLKAVKMSSAERKDAESKLKNWNALTRHIAELDLEGVCQLLVYELASRKRLTVIQRLTARAGVLQQRENEREVMELMAEGLDR